LEFWSNTRLKKNTIAIGKSKDAEWLDTSIIIIPGFWRAKGKVCSGNENAYCSNPSLKNKTTEHLTSHGHNQLLICWTYSQLLANDKSFDIAMRYYPGREFKKDIPFHAFSA
jgi:hypothetical protein